jgi:hypothetical protein
MSVLPFPVVISIEAFFKDDEFVRTRIFPVLLFDCTTANANKE